MKILVTGTAGFIGFHLAQQLVKLKHDIVGVDNINDYYDTQLKFDRLKQAGFDTDKIKWHCEITSKTYPNYRFIRMSIESKGELLSLFDREKFDVVIHLAAQAGVRYSIQNPDAYAQSNLVSFLNILEACRSNPVKHLVYASSSSVYGLNKKMPFSEQDNVDHPISLYAATKKSNELMAHVYSHLYQIPTTGLRFFTVYGPWGRPDMAYFSFAQNIFEGKTIKIFNNGKLKRDFTYIDDIVAGIINATSNIPEAQPDSNEEQNPSTSTTAPYRIYNIGNNTPVELMAFINTIEDAVGKKANVEFLEMQAGDVLATWADVDSLMADAQYSPSTNLEEGIPRFVEWLREYYSLI